jgi:hypothetical protein
VSARGRRAQPARRRAPGAAGGARAGRDRVKASFDKANRSNRGRDAGPGSSAGSRRSRACARRPAARCSPTCTCPSSARRRPRSGRAADPGVPLPADRPARGRRRDGASR